MNKIRLEEGNMSGEGEKDHKTSGVNGKGE